MNAEQWVRDQPLQATAKAEIEVVDDLLDPDECERLIATARDADWLTQTTELPGLPRRVRCANAAEADDGRRTGADGFAVIDDSRLALRLYQRLHGRLPCRLDDTELSGIKSLFRCMHFRPTANSAVQHDPTRAAGPDECSRLSLLIFLNRPEAGGEIDFLDGQTVVEPACGRGVFFRHALPYRHEPVRRGIKHLLRTEIFYNSGWRPLHGG